MIASVPYGSIDFGAVEEAAYGATQRKCARLLRRINRREEKADRARWKGRKRRLKRRADRARSRYLKAGCQDVTGYGPISSKKDRAAADALIAAEAAEAAQAQQADMALYAAEAAAPDQSRAWIIGGVAVVAVLGLALALTGPKK